MKKNLICMLSVCALFTNCTNDDVIVSQPTPPQMDEVTKALGISVGIDTKAIKSGGTFVANTDKIGVFILPVTVDDYPNTPTKSIYTCPASGNDWAPEASPISLNNKTANVFAFYPSTLTPTVATKKMPIDVKATQTLTAGATDQDDYMWATSATTVSNATGKEKISLDFKHVLSQIGFIIIKDATTYTSPASITAFEISNVGGAAKFNAGTATMSLTDGALVFTPATLVNTLKFTPAAAITASAVGTTTPIISGLVAPCPGLSFTLLDVLKINMTVDGKVMTANLPVTIAKWETSKKYTYTLTIAGTGLVPSTVTITDWTVDATPGATSFN